MAQVFQSSSDASFIQPAVLHWKFWEPRADSTKPRSYVLERNATIIAHVGLCPVPMGEGPDALYGMHTIDWVAAPGTVGAGLTIMEELGAEADFMFGIGGSVMARQITHVLGFREISQAVRFARPLRPLSQALSHQTRNWKLLPRLARNMDWAHRPKRPKSHWQIRKLTPGEIPYKQVIGPPQECRFTPRGPAFFEYLRRCPVLPYQVYGLFSEAGPEGYCALGVLRGQARLAGLWLRAPSLDRWRTAYWLVQEAAENLPDAYELALLATAGESAQAAREAGFHPLGELPIYALQKNFTLPAGFQFQMADGDAAFYDPGTPDYWT